MHHAFVVVGSSDRATKYLAERFEITEAPRRFDQFGIDESRLLKAEQSRRLAADERKNIVIIIESISLPAQNALLKTLEEPTPGVHIFFLVPDKQGLLPTLLSRVELIELAAAPNSGEYPDVNKFLAASPEERLALIGQFTDEHETSSELRPLAKRFGAELLAIRRTAELDRAVGFLYDPAALPRLVLEHIAMIV
jgi:DNA polymerase III delta prime subunit